MNTSSTLEGKEKQDALLGILGLSRIRWLKSKKLLVEWFVANREFLTETSFGEITLVFVEKQELMFEY